MSHMAILKLAFGRIDILEKALQQMGYSLQGPGRVRYYGSRSENADRVVKLGRYDLGFKMTAAEAQSRDKTELAGRASQVLHPMYDAWNGEVEKIFGSKLCNLSAKYYAELMRQSAQAAGAMSQTGLRQTETAREIVLELDVCV